MNHVCMVCSSSFTIIPLLMQFFEYDKRGCMMNRCLWKVVIVV